MSLQADIAWVQQEVSKVTNPRLIEALKAMLLYREEKVSTSSEDLVKKRMTDAALASREDVKAGRVYTTEEAERYLDERMRLWK